MSSGDMPRVAGPGVPEYSERREGIVARQLTVTDLARYCIRIASICGSMSTDDVDHNS